MLNLKKRFNSRKRRLNSASSSTVGSVSDLEDRVVMLCEDVPSAFDPGRGLRSPGTRSSQGSRSDGQEFATEPHLIHLSRDRPFPRQACYMEREPPRAHEGFIQVYRYLFLMCRI